MARVSFTLRRPDTDADKGSYLRFDDAVEYDTGGAGGASVAVGVGSRTDYDSALKADGIQLAPTNEFGDLFFSATSVCYGEVSLEWAVNIETTLTASPQVMGIVLVYSPLGEPQTISSGTILVESSTTFSFDHTGLPEGRWAYYSLFVNYRSSGGDNYFERVASLSEIVPKNYGSTLTLWDRIPEYYRYQDTLAGDTSFSPCVATVDPDTPVGPLFKFLSIFGFDMDRVRTLLDYLMVAQDPALANSETLDAISEQMGLELLSSDLGAARLRTMLSDVGFFRRSKGTLAATEYFAKALSGGDIDVDTDTGEITVYSQRTNYIEDPKDASTIVTHRGVQDDEIASQIKFTSGDSYLRTSGVAGSYASSPDADALNISGNLEIVAKVSMEDWTPNAESTIIAKKSSASTSSWYLAIGNTGRPIMMTSADGTTEHIHTASAAIPGTTPNGTMWIKATRTMDNGSSQRETRFYYAADEENEPTGGSWTQLGTTQVNSGVSGVANTTSPVEIGARQNGAFWLFRGRVYRTIVRDGIDGTVVFDADFEHDLYNSSVTTMTEQSVNQAVVTRSSTADFHVEAPPTDTYSYSGGTFSSTATGDTQDVEGVLVHLSSPIPVRLGQDKALFSVQGHTGDNPIVYARLVDGSNTIIGKEETPIVVNGIPYYEIDALNSLVPTIIQSDATSGGSGRSLAFTFASPPLEGDVIVVFANTGNSNIGITLPSGWENSLGAGTETTVFSDGNTFMSFWHVVTAAEADALTVNYTMTNIFDISQSQAGIAVVIRNADVTNPISTSASYSNTANTDFLPYQAITPLHDNCLILTAGGYDLLGSAVVHALHPELTQILETTLGSNLTVNYFNNGLGQSGKTYGPWDSYRASANEEPTTITLAIRPLDPTSQPIGQWVTGYVEFMLDLRNGATFDLANVIVERNHIGEYFDGDTVRGGWLIDSQSVSDYRWSGTANASPSIFAEEYERTKGVLQNLLFDILPVTEADKYTIVKYNGIPGLD